MLNNKTKDNDILDTPFFKHLFFDNYLLKDDNYDSVLSCEIFSTYLKKIGITNAFTNEFNSGLYKDYKVKHSSTYKTLLKNIVLSPSLFL